MVNEFWYVILGILIWQTFVTIFYFVYNESEKFYALSLGIWAPILFAAITVIEKFCFWNYKKYYNLYEMYNENLHHIDNQYIRKSHTKYFKNVYEKGEQVTKPYSIRLLKEGKEFEFYPPVTMQLSLKVIKKGRESGMYTKEYLSNFMKKKNK